MEFPALRAFVHQEPVMTGPSAANEAELIQQLARRNPDASIIELADAYARRSGRTVSTSRIHKALAAIETVKRPLSRGSTTEPAPAPVPAKPAAPRAEKPTPAPMAPPTPAQPPAPARPRFEKPSPQAVPQPPQPEESRAERPAPAVPEQFEAIPVDAPADLPAANGKVKESAHTPVAAHIPAPRDGRIISSIGPAIPAVSPEIAAELEAMRMLVAALAPLSKAAAFRALGWACDALDLDISMTQG